MMKNQDPFPWIRLACYVVMVALFAFYRRRPGIPKPSVPPVTDPNQTGEPRFIWGDWELKNEDCIVLHFRVEGSLIWWLTVDADGPNPREATVMPKNFLPGESGRIEMRYVGLLESVEEESLEFGIRYCTTVGTIETQCFKWSLWRDPVPVAVDAVAAA